MKSPLVSLGSVSTPAGACARLKCSPPTLYKLINEGELQTFKLGKYRKILDSSIDALMKRRLAEAKSAA